MKLIMPSRFLRPRTVCRSRAKRLSFTERLWFHLAVAFFSLALLIILGIALPTRVLLARQVAVQLEVLHRQSVRSSASALSGLQADLQNYALIVAQRPTLQQFLSTEYGSDFLSYLEVLRNSGSIDALVICSGSAEIASTGLPIPEWVCEIDLTGTSIWRTSTDYWIVAAADVESVSGPIHHSVRVLQSTESILTNLESTTGVAHLLLLDDNIIGTLLDNPGPLPSMLIQQLASEDYVSAPIAGTDYLFSVQRLAAGPALLVSIMPIDEILSTQDDINRSLAIGILGVVLLGALLAGMLSWRISYPLETLAAAAGEFRRGNLKKPLRLTSRVTEISQLANALEEARISLSFSLEQLAREKAWIETVMDSITEGILTLDERQRITYASAGIQRILGTGTEQIIGRKVNELFMTPDSDPPFGDQVPDPGNQRKITVRHGSGRELLLAASGSSIFPPEAASARQAVLIRDATNEELLHRMLGDFLANITHEFRTPLAALSASVELLLSELPELTQEELAGLLQSLSLGILKLQFLIENLIEGASLEAGRFKINVTPVAFDDILQDALGQMQALVNLHGLSLTADSAAAFPPVQVDRRRTVQVLVNLISNAIKYSPEGGEIAIHCSAQTTALKVVVADQGPGFLQADQDTLFQRFMPPRGENPPGLGLGLSLVKAIVESQDGTVGLENNPTGGGLVWFTLPWAALEN